MTSLRFAEDESLSLRCNLWNRSRRSSCDLDAASGADADVIVLSDPAPTAESSRRNLVRCDVSFSTATYFATTPIQGGVCDRCGVEIVNTPARPRTDSFPFLFVEKNRKMFQAMQHA